MKIPQMGQIPFVDLAVLTASLVFAVAFAYRVRRRIPVTVTLLAALSLGPSTTFMHMWAHMFAISTVNIMRFTEGKFEYNIRFYALLQLGVVMLLLSGASLHLIRRWAGGAPGLRRPLVALALLQMLFSFPLFPFTPIGTLPGMAALLLLTILYFTRRQFREIKAKKREYVLA